MGQLGHSLRNHRTSDVVLPFPVQDISADIVIRLSLRSDGKNKVRQRPTQNGSLLHDGVGYGNYIVLVRCGYADD